MVIVNTNRLKCTNGPWPKMQCQANKKKITMLSIVSFKL